MRLQGQRRSSQCDHCTQHGRERGGFAGHQGFQDHSYHDIQVPHLFSPQFVQKNPVESDSKHQFESKTHKNPTGSVDLVFQSCLTWCRSGDFLVPDLQTLLDPRHQGVDRRSGTSERFVPHGVRQNGEGTQEKGQEPRLTQGRQAELPSFALDRCKGQPVTWMSASTSARDCQHKTAWWFQTISKIRFVELGLIIPCV